ncbi:MAG TPA: recombination mediator RecR [Gammaproteobacteria bacterium]|nr:recombination mediator RecR [Gammaproteobacteria bacterium]
MSFSPLINQLINALRCLPGVGPKSAQRMVFHLLERDRNGGQLLARILEEAIVKVGRCQECRTLCEDPLCRFCDNPLRDRSIICVVETPADVLAVEHTAGYRGVYFVLMGHLSPLDGIGPENLGMDLFKQRLKQGEIREVIVATNPTVEGEATAHYLAELVKKHDIQVTRIAHGVPFGGELEYIDGGTIARALLARAPL